MTKFDEETVRSALAELDGWELVDGRIRRELRMGSFREAIDLIVRIADLAEAADHHPELTNVYDRVTVELTSHDAGGVTERDLALAGRIDALVAG